MTIYLDIVLLENVLMNYIILYASGVIYKVNIRPIRLIFSSLVGGIYAVISFMNILEIYSNVILKILLSVIMIYVAFIPKTIKVLIKELVIFYLTSFAFGGVAFALLYFIKPQDIFMKNGLYIGTYPLKIVILGAIVGFIIITTAFKLIKGKISRKDMFCDIEIYINGKSKTVRAMIDTGNLLKEPITGRPVVVVEKNMLYELITEKVLNNLESIIHGNIEIELEEYMSKFRIIPFQSIGKQNGMLLGFKADKISIKTEEGSVEVENIIIGIYNHSLTKNGLYAALVGLDILERSENKNEHIAIAQK